jgi:hypothetical protein
MMQKNAIFLIESGKALELVKAHIAHRVRITQEGLALLKELGVEKNLVWTDRSTGVISCIGAKRGQQPEGFTVPDSKGRSWPKKGTEWAKRFNAQNGYPQQSTEIADAFNVPLNLEYKSKSGGNGWCCIGFPLSECGYLYMSNDGPYGLWIPDIPKIIQEREANGDTVTGDAKKFDMRLEGCRRIEPEEWDILAKQHELAERLAQERSKQEAAVQHD